MRSVHIRAFPVRSHIAKSSSRGICRRRRAQLKRAPRGTATIEMVCVAPLVLLFTLATVDFGRVVHAYIQVANAARSGAEYAGMHKFTNYTRSSWESQVRSAVEEEMQGMTGFIPQNLLISIDTTTDADDLFRAAVEVSYPFETVVDWPGVPHNVPLRHRVEMRQIR